MNTRVGRARGRIGRSRQESNCAPGRPRAESTGVDRNRQESSLPMRSEAHEGNGSGAGPSRLWDGSARNSTPVDSCRLLSIRLVFRPTTAIRLLSIPVDSALRPDGYSADPVRIAHRGKSCVKSPSNRHQKKRQKKRRPQEAASLCDKMTILTSESASARYCGSPRRSGHPGDRADPSRIRRW